MEVLVNIIVTIAIILYVLKRMQEVARKGGELTGPPPPERMFEEEEEEREEAPVPERPLRRSPETTQMPERMEIPTVRPRPAAQVPEPTVRKFTVPEEPPRPRQRAVPEITRPQPRHFHVPVETAPSREQRIREVVREDEEGRYADASKPGTRAPAHAPRHKKADGAPRPLLAFYRDDVVRGIIMSEILGPPVGMRREMSR